MAGQTNAFFEHEHFRMLGTIGASEPFQLQLIGDDGSANAVLLKQKVLGVLVQAQALRDQVRAHAIEIAKQVGFDWLFSGNGEL